MSKLVGILLCLALFVAGQAEARPVTEATAKAFKVKAMGFQTKQVPFSYLPNVIGHASFQRLQNLERNWDKLPLSFRQRTFKAFQSAGLERFYWLMLLESGANPDKQSPAGAIGLYQVMPGVAKDVCGLMLPDLFEPEKNSTCALKIMKRCQRFSGWQAQAICYNGKLSACPWKGYQKCLAKKAKAGNVRVLESLYFPIKLFLYQQIGEYFFKEDLQLSKPHKAKKIKSPSRKRK